jgi:hypothetical protein
MRMNNEHYMNIILIDFENVLTPEIILGELNHNDRIKLRIKIKIENK